MTLYRLQIDPIEKARKAHPDRQTVQITEVIRADSEVPQSDPQVFGVEKGNILHVKFARKQKGNDRWL